MRPYAIAVIGLGVISRFYLAAIEACPAVRLAAVCDRAEDALAPWRGRVPCHLDHREALAAGPRWDAAVVAVPNDAHADVCADLLRAGVPVCVEKPLARTRAEGEELTRLARVCGVPLVTAFHRRHNRAVAELVAALPRDVPVTRVRVRYFERIEQHVGRDRWYLDPARSGGGCLADNGPNAFDLVRLVLGETSVNAAHVRWDRAGVDRTALIELRAASGADATVELDWSYPGELKDITVTLADGMTRHADMLAGHDGFKASLWHEYRAILADLVTRLAAHNTGLTYRQVHPDEGGIEALRLVEAAYRLAMRPIGEPTTARPW